MIRSRSPLAQLSFDCKNRLQHLARHSGLHVSLSARAVNRLLRPIAKRAGTGHIVSADLYGHSLTMPAEHPLAPTLADFPQYNRPLALTAQALANTGARQSEFTVIDVGANIGETIAIIEQQCPGTYSFLCIEPDRDLAELCTLNHRGNSRVEVKQCFIGEREGGTVQLQDDGRANPSTKLAAEVQPGGTGTRGQLVRLDTAARAFVESHQSFTLLKVDTEGYDFAVIRSGDALVSRYKPAIYFEWFPELLLGLHEEVWSGFEYLARLGYRYFVFFTSYGDFHCNVSSPDRMFLRGLASLALKNKAVQYFDVLASTSEEVMNELVELSIAD